MHPGEFIAPPLILGTILFGIYSIIRIVQESRLKRILIEKGADKDTISEIFKNQSKDPYPNVRIGLILVGLGLALGLGEIFDNPQLTAAMMIASAGLAFLFYFIIIKNHPNYANKNTMFAK